jgi:pSer/pThr/pTyr-binding forkhead associated (FHA) protein
MSSSSLSPHLASPAELKARIAAERSGRPLLIYRDEQGAQRILPLEPGRMATIGRDPGCSVPVPWDTRVSRLHAELRQLEGHWLVVDDGLSRNGTFVNGERVTGRRRLDDGDLVEVGETALAFRDPLHPKGLSTAAAGASVMAPELSPAQRRVLVALCRPFRHGDQFARPPSNQQIATELHLSVPAVKTHLRTLFQRFGIPDLAHNEKRAALVPAAFDSCAVSPADLDASV